MSERRDPDRLYGRLPVLYRELDAREGHPLRALLRLINEQADLVHADIERLWENFFIETCDRWVIPYIGDLVSNNAIHTGDRLDTPDTARELFPDLAGPDLRPPIAVRTRADVAKTIYYRRRKGTLPMLEELARDVTGWAAHAVEFFELLGWNQHLDHLRPHSTECAEIRRVGTAERAHGPFDEFAHNVDVRRIAQDEGWHNLPNVGFFLWRLESYPLVSVPARPAAEPWAYHFSPLGNPAPLFSRWRREGDESGLATELHVPGPIRPARFYEDLRAYRALTPPPERPPFTDFYGGFDHEKSLTVFVDGVEVPPAADPGAPPVAFEPRVVCRRLDPWPATRPTGRVVAIDVSSGRLALGEDWGDPPTLAVDTSHHYGFSADLGGGPYPRGRWLLAAGLAEAVYRVKEDGTVPPGVEPPTHTRLVDALTDWEAAGRPDALVEILDSRTYDLPAALDLRDGSWLVIQAADRQRPVLRAPDGWAIGSVAGPGVGRRPELTLSGVVIEGWLRVEGDLGRLRLLHTTVVPGRELADDGSTATTEPSLIAAAGSAAEPINTSLRLEIAFSITGPLRLPAHAEGLWALDSIVDGLMTSSGHHGAAIAATGTDDEPGPAATLERVTVFGPTYFRELPLASEAIFTAPVTVERKQRGCVRFSYVPPGSLTPRRYRCQPDLESGRRIEAIEEASGAAPSDAERAVIEAAVARWLVPTFTALPYGLPAYAQLRLSSPVQIRTGAEDGAEMGAFCHLKQPQRETNLRIRLEEYLPFGLEPGPIYVT